MQNYVKALQDYCKQNPPNPGNAKSILELLYWHYAEYNPVDNKEIRNGFSRIRQQYSHLSMQEFDPIFTTVSDLCVEHERRAGVVAPYALLSAVRYLLPANRF